MRISDWSSDVCSSDLQQILDEIEDYNRIDCQSTQLLRDWLVGIRPDGPWPVLAQDAAEQEVVEDEETTALRDRLAASSLTPERQELLFNLGLFHKREAKPAQWTVFDSAARDEIGRASCRERVCTYVWISVGAVALKKKTNKQNKETK